MARIGEGPAKTLLSILTSPAWRVLIIGRSLVRVQPGPCGSRRVDNLPSAFQRIAVTRCAVTLPRPTRSAAPVLTQERRDVRGLHDPRPCRACAPLPCGCESP